MASIEIKGMEKLSRIVAGGGDNAIKALAKGLYVEANAAFNESQILVPVDTSALKGSGHVTLPQITPNSVEVTIAYGGPATSYAIYVHERIFAPSGKKVYHKPPTRAKFLETPAKRRTKGMATRLGVYIREAMRGQ
jgi:hypothetical protein